MTLRTWYAALQQWERIGLSAVIAWLVWAAYAAYTWWWQS